MKELFALLTIASFVFIFIGPAGYNMAGIIGTLLFGSIAGLLE